MSYIQLTEVERYQIRAFLKAGYSQKEIAAELKRPATTISRELERNTGLRGDRPQQAQRLAEKRKVYHCQTRISDNTWNAVEERLREDWSPEQVSKRFSVEGLLTVSTEWIYHYILMDKGKGAVCTPIYAVRKNARNVIR